MMELNLISWNVNGIRAAEKKGFLDWLAGTNADIIAIQETKARPEQLSKGLLTPPGYHAYWCAAEKPGYSGVATYSRLAPVDVKTGLDDPRFDHEGRTLITDYGDFVLFNIYFPNGGRGPEWVTHKINFYRRFLDVAQEYMAQGRRVIVTGDVNTAYTEKDLARPRENARTSGFLPHEREALGEFFTAGLIDTFRHVRPDEIKYSWWDMKSGARARNIGWRIDYFFVSPDLRDCVVDADIHMDIVGSDHCPISLKVKW